MVVRCVVRRRPAKPAIKFQEKPKQEPENPEEKKKCPSLKKGLTPKPPVVNPNAPVKKQPEITPEEEAK